MAKKFTTQRATVLLLVLFWLPSTFANTKYNDNERYEVVVADATGKDTEAPGIYKINRRTGDSELILSGTIPNVNRAMKGIRQYVPISSSTARDALAIVNGRITLFNYNTKPNNPKSYLQFGSTQAPVIDILSGRALQIPLIKDDAEVTIFEGAQFGSGFPKGAQLYVISVKAPSVLGTGLTFAVLVSGSAENDKVSLASQNALLISHDYYDLNQLKRLASSYNLAEFPSIFAPSQIESVQSQLETLATPGSTTSKWAQHLSKFLKYLETGKGPNNAAVDQQTVRAMQIGVPLYNLQISSPASADLPVDLIVPPESTGANHVFGQVYDPYSQRFNLINSHNVSLTPINLGKDSVYFAHRTEIQEHSFYDGSVGRDKNGKPLIFGLYTTNSFRKDLNEEATNTEYTNTFIFANGQNQLILVARDGDQRKVTYPLSSIGYRPGDRVNIMWAGDVKDLSGRDFRTYFVLHQSRSAKKCQIYSLIFEQSHSPRIIASSTIYDGPAMSAQEMMLRTKIDAHDTLFDNVTPVNGATAYKKVKAAERAAQTDTTDGAVTKTIPYLRVLAGVTAAAHPYAQQTQRYLKALVDNELTSNLRYRYYDPQGSSNNASGFYLFRGDNVKNTMFVPGRPLYAKKKTGGQPKEVTYISDTIDIDPLSGSGYSFSSVPMKVHFIPFSERVNVPKGQELNGNEFNIAIATNASNEGSKVFGTISYVQIRYPFKSLAYTKIIKGIKGKSNEFYVLLFFKKDVNIPGSQDVVVAFNGKMKTERTGDTGQAVLELSNSSILHRNFVPPESIKNHIRENAEGDFFWVVDPSISAESSKFQVRKIANPEEHVINRRGMSLGLRESDSTKDTKVGHLGGYQRRVGGKWEVHSDWTMKERISGARDLIEEGEKQTKRNSGKKEKDSKDQDSNEPKQAAADSIAEKQFFDGFAAHLDQIASTKGPEANKVEVILVEHSMKQKFRQFLIKKLALDKNGRFNISNTNFDFHYADMALDDIEVGEEFQGLRQSDPSKSKLLFVEPETMNGSTIAVRNPDVVKSDPSNYDDDYGFYSPPKETVDPNAEPLFKYDDQDEQGNLAVAIATGGLAKTVKGFRKVRGTAKQVPTIILASPDEWRNVQQMNEAELESGVFENFHLNFNYLTAPWSVWPPATEKSTQDIRALVKTPYNIEEMKVFPTLDKILTDAASGHMKGKQKILIVPPELLPIINKLILLRWANHDVAAAGEWSFSNRKLAFFRLNTTDITQSGIQDNFRAMKGAASSRNSVLYGDLETILRIGRPTNQQGRNFTLRDPIKTSEQLIMESDIDSIVASATGSGDALPVLSEEEKAQIAELQSNLEAYKSELHEFEQELQNLEGQKADMDEEEFKTEKSRLEEGLRTSQGFVDSIRNQIHTLEASGEQNEMTSVSDTKHYPHMMWWVAAEGQSIQPKRARGWKLSDDATRSSATLLIGTEDQLAQIESNLTFESKFFNLKEHFEVERLLPPSEDTKFNLINQLFNRPEVAALHINFQLNDQSDRDPKSQIIYQFINRIDQLAYDQKMEKTTAFVKAFIVLRQSLSEDLDLRRTRIIDQKYIERLFTRVFPMPLNPEILEPHDPLNQIRNVEQAGRNLQKAGYEGSQDLKRRFFETILSQTRTTDTSRPIPNSQILFGGTSTGKTFLVRTFFKMAGLVEYNPNRPNNEDADYYLFSCGDVTTDKTNEPSKMTVDELIANILDLMSQRKGPRASIVIDDFHKAPSTEVRQKIFRFVQGLLDAKNGMITVRSKDGRKVREIPVQNLNIYMTLNPTSNEEIRRQYVVPGMRYTPAELLKREVLAALSDKEFAPEDSELARWADIINMDTFPRSAKVPELGRRVREYSRGSRSMMLVAPTVIDSLVEKFSNANARELLAPAAAALTSVPSSAQDARIYTVTLRHDPDQKSVLFPGGMGVEGQINQSELQSAVRRITQVDPVSMDNPKSILRFMSFLLQNFRLQVLNGMSLEAHMSDTLRLDKPGMASLLKSNFLIGSAVHVLDNPTLPVGELAIRPDQLSFFNRSEQEEFYRQFKMEHTTKYFPAGFTSRVTNEQADLDSFLQGTISTAQTPHTRKAVISTYVDRTQAVLVKALLIYLRLNTVSELRDLNAMNDAQMRGWFERLNEQNPDREFKVLMQEMLNLFLDFEEDFNSPELADFNSPESPDLTIFDEVRMFNYIVDKAITQLPWGNVSKFTYDVVDSARDLSLGSKTSYKEYIGVHAISPFAVTTPEFMQEMLDVGFNSQTGKSEVDRPTRLQILKRGFESACEKLLKGP